MAISLKNINGERIECPMGFSWTTLFLGFFVPLFRGDWKWFVIMLLSGVISIGLSWFVFPFIYNKIYIKELLDKGFYAASDKDASTLSEIEVSSSNTPKPDKQTEAKIDTSYSNETEKLLKPQYMNTSNVVIEKLDFTTVVVFEWPVELQSGTIEQTQNRDGEEKLSATVEVTNVQSLTIKYMEWELECFDILKRPIVCKSPVLVQHEKILKTGQTTVAITEKNLPSKTRSFKPWLVAVLYENEQIAKFTKDIKISSVSPRKEIKELEIPEDDIIVFFQEEHSLPIKQQYIYDTNIEGIWTCAFCGSRNKEDFLKCRCCGIDLEIQKMCVENNPF